VLIQVRLGFRQATESGPSAVMSHSGRHPKDKNQGGLDERADARLNV